MAYTFEDFEKERDWLLNEDNPATVIIPSPAFCKMFMDRLDTEAAEEEGYYDDRSDYHGWGLALYDDVHYNAEDEVSVLNLWHWVFFYEGVQEKNYDTIKDSLNDIFEDELPHVEFSVQVGMGDKTGEL